MGIINVLIRDLETTTRRSVSQPEPILPMFVNLLGTRYGPFLVCPTHYYPTMVSLR